jgi:hypothetical protein
VTEFSIPTANAMPRGIGGLLQPCFAEFGANQIGCIENGQVIERRLLNPDSGPQNVSSLTNRTDIWFTENTGNRIGVVHFSGVASLAQAGIEEFPIPTGHCFSQTSRADLSDLASGQLRVTRTTDQGLLWLPGYGQRRRRGVSLFRVESLTGRPGVAQGGPGTSWMPRALAARPETRRAGSS